MCGIAGGIWRVSANDIEQRLDAALRCMRHRGPNDHGTELQSKPNYTVAIGQTRLSVIDLSSGGHQPMVSDDGSLAIVFNGEIYNYRELRDELRALGHVFRSESDTEVLLASWAHWHKECLTKLEGMFAFVVHDRRNERLFCARDAFGIKPFFYAQNDDGFLFASEQPAMRSLRRELPRPDLQRSYDYLVHGDYDSQERTFIEGVKHLLPGSFLDIDLSSKQEAEPVSWWKPSIEQTSRLSYADAVDAVREQFLHNIKLHLRSDVPLGAALSGGIDSSAVVCAMRKIEPDKPIHTFSYIAEGSDVSEEHWVDLVNKTINATPHKVKASGADLVRDLDVIIAAQGEPFGSTSIYAQYCVFRLARDCGITVTLDGQGADELLAGYHGYPGQRMLSLAESGRFYAMHQFARQWGRWPGKSYKRAWMYLGHSILPDWIYGLARDAAGDAAKPSWLDIQFLQDAGVNLRKPRVVLQPEGRGRRVTEQLASTLQGRGLPHLLRHGDRNAMAFSIESRVPFLTTQMADLLLPMPENYLISDTGQTKSVFRAAMRGIVPDPILDRHDKIGFATPEREWLMNAAPSLRGWLEECGNIPFINRTNLLAGFDKTVSGEVNFSWQLWRWVNYCRWYQLAIA